MITPQITSTPSIQPPVELRVKQAADPIASLDPVDPLSKTSHTNSRSSDTASYSTIIEAGDYLSLSIPKGSIIRIVDLMGNQAVDTLFFNAAHTGERYSAQDTIREQSNIYLTIGSKLISNEGNILFTIVDDTCGRHDTLGGACSMESNMVRYAIETRPMHACRQSFVKGAQEWSKQTGVALDKRDLAANINFFMNVPVTPDGGLTFADGISEPGKYVELRAEMDTLMLVSNCPQLNNPCNAYNPTPVQILMWSGEL